MEVTMNAVVLELDFADDRSSLRVYTGGTHIMRPVDLLGASEVEAKTACGVWTGNVQSVYLGGSKAVLRLTTARYAGALKTYLAHTSTGCSISAQPVGVVKVTGSSGEAGSVEEYMALRAEAPDINLVTDQINTRLKELDPIIMSRVGDWRAGDETVPRRVAADLWVIDEWSTFQHHWDWAAYGPQLVERLLEAEIDDATAPAQMLLEALAAKIQCPNISWLVLRAYYEVSQDDISSFL